MMYRPATEAELREYVERAEIHINVGFAKQFPNNPTRKLTYKTGRRYARIMVSSGPSISAWGFIDMTNGNVLKAAGWKAPAKGPRGNIRDDEYGLGAAHWSAIR